MVVITAFVLLSTFAIAFYVRFLLAIYKECEGDRTYHLMCFRSDSGESVRVADRTMETPFLRAARRRGTPFRDERIGVGGQSCWGDGNTKTRSGDLLAMEQASIAAEAIRIYTVFRAHSGFQETKNKGSIEAGKRQTRSRVREFR